MNVISAALLGLLQGLTEFLPVSSSGHLMIFSEWLGVDLESGMFGSFTVMLHIGTLIAVLFVYWDRIWNMIQHPIQSELKWLVLATLPTVLFTLLAGDLVSDALARTLLPWAFFLTAILMFVSNKICQYRAVAKGTHKTVRWSDALAMGAMQCVGTFSGVSRSGSTITGGLITGLNRRSVADFSFLMSIPAILGAAVLDGYDMISSGQITLLQEIGFLPTLVGVLVAMVSGFFAIQWMLRIIRKVELKWFAIYVGLLGMVILFNDLAVRLW